MPDNEQPKEFGSYPLVSKALREGAHLHAFRSGDGLRVVRVEGHQLLGYGEHPYIEQAFDYCEEDLQAGQRRTLHPHYSMGSSLPSSRVDDWIKCGRDFDIQYHQGAFIFLGKYFADPVPRDVIERVRRTGCSEYFDDDRGFTHEILPYPRNCISIKPVSPYYHEYIYVSVRSGTLEDLLKKLEQKFAEI